MKEFQIFIESHLTEANVYFRSHVTECDVIIYSIPRREVVAIKEELALYLRQRLLDGVVCEGFVQDVGSSIIIKAQASESAIKMIIVSSASNLSQVIHEIAEKFISSDSALSMNQTASLSSGRYRLFSDMDENTLGTYDEMSLGEVDFIFSD